MNGINKCIAMLSFAALLFVPIVSAMDLDGSTGLKEAAASKIEGMFKLRRIKFDELKKKVKTKIQILKQLGAEDFVIKYEKMLNNREVLEEKRKEKEQSRKEREVKKEKENEKQFEEIKIKLSELIESGKDDIGDKKFKFRRIKKQKRNRQNIIKAVGEGIGFKKVIEDVNKHYSEIDTSKFTKEQRKKIESIFSEYEKHITNIKEGYMSDLLRMLKEPLDGLKKAVLQKIDLAKKNKQFAGVDPQIAKFINFYIKYVNVIMNNAYKAETKKGDFFIKNIQGYRSLQGIIQKAKKLVEAMTGILKVTQEANEVGLIDDEKTLELVNQIKKQREEFITEYNKYMEEKIPINYKEA